MAVGGFILDDMAALVTAVSRDRLSFGPMAYEGEYAFRELRPGSEIKLGCQVTMLPPKHVIQPVWQELFSFSAASGRLTQPSLDQPLAIIGISPCDVHALLALDRVFGGEHPDPYYGRRRQATLIVAANCSRLEPESFCTSWNTGPELNSHYDLLLTEIGNGYLLEVGSASGEKIAAALGLPPATAAHLTEKALRLEQARASARKRLPLAPDQLHRFFQERWGHPAWSPNADACFSCGNCTITCPTCYCFDMRDEVRSGQGGGCRSCEWDSCQLKEFSQVALGANFRPRRLDRFQHRAVHKLSWMEQQYGLSGCVGCGRCVRWCPSWPERRGRATALADPVEIITDLMEAEEEFGKFKPPGAIV